MRDVGNRTRIESRTREIGHAFFDAVEASKPSVIQPEWWEERAMSQLMDDEWLKVQAFRFIDVVPMLKDDVDIARHLREYFVHPSVGNGRSNSDVSAITRVLSRVMRFSRLNSPRAQLLAWIARNTTVFMAGRFLAGETPEQASRTIQRLRSRQLAFSIDVLGEAAVSETEAVNYQRIYLELIEQLGERSRAWSFEPLVDSADGVAIPSVNVSVKLTSLFSQFDPIDPVETRRAVLERLRPLLRAGMRQGAHVHIDMEHYAIKDLTLDICREVFCEREFRDYPHFGLVLQAYLKDGDRDLRDTIGWVRERGTPIWIRLVKGAYWDTETVLAKQFRWPCPVWQQKWQSDACFERMAGELVRNHRVICGAFASHNIRSLAHAMALREHYDVPGTAFELQMLYGMADGMKRAAVRMNQRCRIYTPYGELLPGMAYLIRRLLENTANESFVRISVDEDTPRDLLLDDPAAQAPQRAPLCAPMDDPGDFSMQPFMNVPDTDFSREPNRQKLLDALTSVSKSLGGDHPIVIGNEDVTTGVWGESRDPSKPSRLVGRAAMGDEPTVERAVGAAHDAFKSWRRVPVAQRAAFLTRVAQRLEQQRHHFSAIAVFECAKPWREADADISEAIDFCNYYAEQMIQLSSPRRRDVPGENNEYFYAARGVVVVIAPWNFPLAILAGMTTAALVAGNTVIMKPAEQSPVIAAEFMRLFREAGLPSGVLNYLPGDGETVGAALVKHPKVAMTVFTGSRVVGDEITRVSAANHTDQPGMKKVVAEMGGKNATIIDADADLDEAVHGVVHASFGFAGQKCSASSRCIVLAPVYDRFVDRLVEATRSIQVSAAEEPGTVVPPVIDEDSYDRCMRYIEIGKSEAKLAISLDVAHLRESLGGWFVPPTIFVDVDPQARIAQEEIFGPVLAVIKAESIEHAIEICNDTDYALTAGIFSRSPASIQKARIECECGNFYINRKITGALVDKQPFGGFKMSGIGSKAGGPDYLLQFCEPRTVTENTLRRGFAPSEEVAESLSEVS